MWERAVGNIAGRETDSIEKVGDDFCFQGLSLTACFLQLGPSSRSFHRLRPITHQQRSKRSRHECLKGIYRYKPRLCISSLSPGSPMAASPILAQDDKEN